MLKNRLDRPCQCGSGKKARACCDGPINYDPDGDWVIKFSPAFEAEHGDRTKGIGKSLFDETFEKHLPFMPRHPINFLRHRVVTKDDLKPFEVAISVDWRYRQVIIQQSSEVPDIVNGDAKFTLSDGQWTELKEALTK